METVTLQPIYHQQQDCIGIYCVQNVLLNKCIKEQGGAKWSRTHHCWYLPCTKTNVKQLANALNGKAILQIAALKKYLQEKSRQNYEVPKQAKLPPVVIADIKSAKQPFKKPVVELSEANNTALELFTQQLVLKAYSPSTIKTYRNELMQFLQAIKNKPATEFSTARIKNYLQYCFETLKLSEATLHSRMNALKFYYEQVLNKEKFFWEIPRPKKQHQNPAFFNQDEIASIIKQTENLKHKTMLMLAYSTGMRISEVTALKVWQIDSRRMQIIVQQAKGKKDRMTPLSPVLLVMLRAYFTACKPDKKGYLFCGQQPGEPYSTRSLQLILQTAKQRAGILKPGSMHALRHSFATHLLDKGTDVTMIMKLLGHNDIKTTLRYLHVTNRDVLNIISPLDQLNLD
jgi:site-specific recombinase XerD